MAIGVHGNPAAAVCGHGRPSGKGVRAARGASVAYKADTEDPGYLEGMKMVNSLCAWMRRFVEGCVGMKVSGLQGHLNWYAYLFRVKQADERRPKAARALRHLMLTEAHCRSPRKRKHPHSG